MIKKTLIAGVFCSLASYACAAQFKPNSEGPTLILKAVNPIESNSRYQRSADRVYLYNVILNPFYVNELAKNNPMQIGVKEILTIGSDKVEISAVNALAISELLQQYGLASEGVFPYSPVGFRAWISDGMLETIRSDTRISGLRQIDKSEKLKTSNAPGDLVIGNETTSWAVGYVGASANLHSSTNPFYLIDGNPFGMVASPSEFNYTRVQLFGSNAAEVGYKYHVAHVGGLIAGITNNKYIKGVNPGQHLKIFAVDGGYSQGQDGEDVSNVSLALGAAQSHAENLNEFGVLNISMNNGPGNPDNHFSANREVGMSMRVASNRFLIANSAGNNDDNACQFAYSRPSVNDGIIVVGGLKQDGSRFSLGDGAINSWPKANPPVQPQPAAGSNFGNCIEMWAPGFRITSYDYYGGVNELTGTSFSAPIVAAIASRFGDSQTRPIVRERIIVDSAVLTGKKDGSRDIKRVNYDSKQQLPLSLVSPISVHPNGIASDVPKLHNGKFYDDGGIYEFNASSGSLVIDTKISAGTRVIIDGVRLSLNTSANPYIGGGSVTFKVFGGYSRDNVNIPFNQPDVIEDMQLNLAPVYIPVNTFYPFIRIQAVNSFSNLAFSEVEVYKANFTSGSKRSGLLTNLKSILD